MVILSVYPFAGTVQNCGTELEVHIADVSGVR